ncbi:MAG TPA: SBBP repeat-containing protein [Bacteroidales bacterium]
MKKTLFISGLTLVLLLQVNVLFSQTPEWLWAKNATDIYQDFSYSVATDVDGNVIITGEFYGSPISFGDHDLTNVAYSDVFIAKYSSIGNVLWAVSAGGMLYESGAGVATDADGNIYVTGSFNSPTINFGSTPVSNSNSGNDTYDAFLAKYSTAGELLWVFGAAGANDDFAKSIAVDNEGNVFVTGSFNSSTLTFGNIVLTNTDPVSEKEDIFIVKVNSSGEVLWANNEGGTDKDFGTSVACDGSGNSFITGYFNSSALMIGTFPLVNTGNWDLFLAKYDPNGNVLWARGAVGDYVDRGTGITTDTSGNVCFTGAFYSSSLTFGTISIQNGGGSANGNIFIAKYNSSGTPLWASNVGWVGPVQNVYYSSICSDKANEFYVTGWFASETMTIGTAVFTNNGASDIFVAKYSPSGIVDWAKQISGDGGDYCNGIATSLPGNVFVTGYFNGDALNFDGLSLTNSGYIDIFVADIQTTMPNSIFDNNVDRNLFSCFPNPANNNLAIVLSNVANNASVNIYDLQGRKLFHQVLYSEKTNIDISSIAHGVYFVFVRNNDKSSTVKLIKD